MGHRINIREKENEAYNAMNDLDKYVSNSSYAKSRLYLIENKVSQINGCAYCVINQRITGVDLWIVLLYLGSAS